MPNVAYIVAAYAITLGALALYAALILWRLRRAERLRAAVHRGAQAT